MEFQVKLEISDDMIEVLIDMAGYGIGYWSDLGEIDDKARTYTVRDTEDVGGRHTLTYEQLAEALVKVANRDVQVASYIVNYATNAIRDDDPGYIDSELADVVVQVAAFGEIVYG